MKQAEDSITFKRRDFKGSRLRCLMLTSLPERRFAETLSEIVAPHAGVAPHHLHAPRGFLHPDEAKLGETPGFLSDLQRNELTGWWLEETRNANTPNWDLVSQCCIGDQDGLILVEAKSHEGEFHTKSDMCGAKEPNARKIREAIREATQDLDRLSPGFALSSDSHYQLSNRFAFAWTLAKMGIPSVLVYLGFLDAHEMKDGRRKLLESHDQWRNCVLRKSEGRIPKEAWDRTFDVDGVPVTILVRSAYVGIQAILASSSGSSAKTEEPTTVTQPALTKVPKKGNLS